MDGQNFLWLSEFLFPGAAAQVPWDRGLRVLRTMVEHCKLAQSRSREEHIPVLWLGAQVAIDPFKN